MFDIRPATESDASQIGRFLDKFRSASSERRGARDFLDGSYLVAHPSEVGSSADFLVVLCLREGDLLGIGALCFRDADAVVRGRLELFCSDDPDVATDVIQRLLEAAEAEARARGVREFDVFSLPGDQPLKSSLEERGYRARLLILHRTL